MAPIRSLGEGQIFSYQKECYSPLRTNTPMEIPKFKNKT